MRHEFVDVIEPALMPEIFITGILPVEDGGDFVRVVGHVDRNNAGIRERIVMVRLVMTTHAFEEVLAVANRSAPRRLALVK